MSTKSIRILLVDDHALFRQGLKFLLHSQPRYQVLAELGSLDQVLPCLQEQSFDLMILDYHMPGGESSAMLAYCKQRYPDMKVLALTGANSGIVFKQMRDAKADAVMQKEASPDELLLCLQQILQEHSSQTILSAAVQEQIDASETDLTPRELQILALIYQGHPTTEIAEQLSLSAKTVDKHRENLMRKLNVNNVVQLIHRVQELKLL
ncbi:response regulator transcription factor [Undibacterium cyanobacteriorum]|uniref:Response regulator transcription factor n=1 Tax=Undibacterium cyanobacteriorum TaxID=3073561 RepID=A0ABY9RH36_9BURK|nr:response regulator transcription factor [Undibacterium sp. 20NA77.5]WMW80538.1 response regulator transcription factor [Undibacterium sp. 20NA77.5]